MTLTLPNNQRWLKKNWLWLLTNIGALIPLALLIWDFTQGGLGADPVAEITNRTGKTAIILLMLSLACTPLNILSGYSQVLPLRKPLGLYAFLYASFHFLNFVGLDYGFELRFILNDALLKKPYILVGLTALIILIPLAITSTKGWMKRLGRNWKRLHQLVYVAGGMAVLHFLWLAKAAVRWEPLLYALLLTFLLVVRVPPVRKFIIGLRQGKGGSKTRSTARKPRPTAERGQTTDKAIAPESA